MPTGYRSNGQIKPGTRIVANCDDCYDTATLTRLQDAALELGAIRLTWGTVNTMGRATFAFEVIDFDAFEIAVTRAGLSNPFLQACRWQPDVDRGAHRKPRLSDALQLD